MRPWWGLAEALASWRIRPLGEGANVGGAMSDYQDLIVTREGGVATVAINRPKVLNAMRAETVEELIRAIDAAGWDKSIGVIVLTGTGKAFCTGGDQSAHEGKYNGRGTIGMPIEALQSLIRDVPKPVIARVHGYAIGGGNVLATICDLTIASESAVFGQVGPKVGSVDPGFGTAYLARVVGEKKAREIWYLCRRYTAKEALAMGLVNTVVPDDQLDAEVAKWCAEILERSPSAIAIAKRSFNADTESIRALSWMGMQTLSFYYDTEESREGVRAFMEKRKPEFRKHMR
jgi:2-ketocyclohexanecarboxyl-CoA hydrolase